MIEVWIGLMVLTVSNILLWYSMRTSREIEDLVIAAIENHRDAIAQLQRRSNPQ